MELVVNKMAKNPAKHIRVRFWCTGPWYAKGQVAHFFFYLPFDIPADAVRRAILMLPYDVGIRVEGR